jgi:hypothetical protein
MSAMRELAISQEVPLSEPSWTSEREGVNPEVIALQRAFRWNPDRFAQEQIQGLVRQVFLAQTARPVRQVVFSAVDAETDVHTLCRQVGEALAEETAGRVAVMGGFPRLVSGKDTAPHPTDAGDDGMRPGTLPPLRRIATRVRGNLWLVPGAAGDNERRTTASVHSYLGELRREFEFSIIETPPAGDSNDTIAMAQFADGVILVLSAQHTRRVTALQVKRSLEAAQARLLGTVLTDRLFPIPEKIYRRL